MASGALDDDVAALSAWISELQRLAGVQEGHEADVAAFARAVVPELPGPLGRYARQLRAFHGAQLEMLERGEPLERLPEVAERVESLRRRCADIRRAHEQCRIVPGRRNVEESSADHGRLCRIEFELAVSRASVEVMVLARQLGASPEKYQALERSEHRRAARLQLELLDVMSVPEALCEDLDKEREYWSEVAESGVARPPRQLDPDEVARRWIDKLANLVVLYEMVLEKGTDTPARWCGRPPAGRLEDWMTAFARLERLSRKSHLFVAGSTHPGEEAALIAAFAEARGKRRDLTLVLAPRWSDGRHENDGVELPGICRDAQRLGRVRTFSQLGSWRSVDAVVVDCVGMLRAIYGLGEGAFVAGSLLASSGHNFCEPMVFGIPTWTGPNHYADFRGWQEAQRALSPHLRVVQLDGLTNMMREWIDGVDSGRIERERGDVQHTLTRYLRSLADRSLEAVQAVPRGVWECAAHFADPGCAHCGGNGARCRHLAEMDRFRMCAAGQPRWFVPAFSRYVLERLDAGSQP